MDIPDNTPGSLTELIAYFNKNKIETPYNSKKNQQPFYIYEMGRGIKQISNQLFTQFENTQAAWPYPFLRSAWFALFFSDPIDPEDYHIWFLKFPLDEQGKLVQAARDDYLMQFYKQVLEKMDKQLSKEGLAQSSAIASESPYGFKPSEEKMANINAIIKHQVNKLPSKYYQDVLNYLFQQPEPQWNNWQSLGYQGLADLSCHMYNQYQGEIIEQKLADNIQNLPIEMLSALSTCLEHHQLSQHLVEALVQRAENNNQLDNMIACLRSISASDTQAINKLLKQALNSDYKSNIELLAVVCGRCWNSLKEPWLMYLFLEALAITKSSTQAFNIMSSDLLFIPGMRETVLEQFRNPDRSAELTVAIGHFYSSTR